MTVHIQQEQHLSNACPLDIEPDVAIAARPTKEGFERRGDVHVISIKDIKIGKRHRKDLGDIASLARSIEEVSLLHPPVVNRDNRLVAGARRIVAVKKLGWTEVPVRVVDLDHIARGEFAENSERKDFTPSEAVAIARALEPVEREKARARQGARTDIVEIFHEVDAGKTRDKVGAFVGRTGRTIDKARAVVEAAEAEPEKYGKLVDLMDRTGRVDGVFKVLKARKQAEQIRAEPPTLPGRGPYRVIVADPPWEKLERAEAPANRANASYPYMSIEAICALPVSSIAADDCILWLWTINNHMRDAFAVLDAWGFKQKTILTWVKDRMGLGNWLRGQTEHCILATRGKPTVELTNQTTVLHGRVRAHSQKPEEFYAMVEALCPAPRYAELFARQQRSNWDGHGDELRMANVAASVDPASTTEESGVPRFLQRNPDNTFKYPGKIESE